MEQTATPSQLLQRSIQAVQPLLLRTVRPVAFCSSLRFTVHSRDPQADLHFIKSNWGTLSKGVFFEQSGILALVVGEFRQLMPRRSTLRDLDRNGPPTAPRALVGKKYFLDLDVR